MKGIKFRGLEVTDIWIPVGDPFPLTLLFPFVFYIDLINIYMYIYIYIDDDRCFSPLDAHAQWLMWRLEDALWWW